MSLIALSILTVTSSAAALVIISYPTWFITVLIEGTVKDVTLKA